MSTINREEYVKSQNKLMLALNMEILSLYLQI